MAIVLNDYPGPLLSAHGDIIFTVYESIKSNDPITYPNYKYIADIYIAGVLVARLKKAPHPDNNRGVFNIGSIVRDYVGTPFNPTPSVFFAQVSGNEEYYATVQVKFGEEYEDTIYTNLTVDIERQYFDHYNGRLIGSETVLYPLFGKVISNRPYATTVFNTGRCFLPIIPNGTPLNIEVKTYNSALIDTETTTRPVSAFLQIYDISPSGINAEFPGLINSFVEYYTVQLGPDSIYRFDIDCEPRYDIYTLHFKNQYGGFESKAFSKVSRKKIDIKKKDFGKLPYTLTSGGFVLYYNSNNVYSDQRSVYASTYTETWVLNSDILSDGEYRWLGDLMISTMIYIELDGYYLPVTIKENNYEYRKQINDKLTNLTIEIEFGETYAAQYR